MIKRLAILAFAALCFTAADAQAQYFDIKKGNDAYNEAKYGEAKVNYEKVIAELEDIQDKKEAIYNRANVDFREKNYNEAEKEYNTITSNSALPENLRGDAAYNRGNTIYRKADGANNPSEKMDLLGKALQSYKESLALNPSDREAKINYEFTKAQMKKLEDQQKNQEQKKEEKKEEQKQEEQKKEKEEPQKQQQQPEQNNFSKDQAERILNALKQDEKNMLKKYQNKSSAQRETDKDW